MRGPRRRAGLAAAVATLAALTALTGCADARTVDIDQGGPTLATDTATSATPTAAGPATPGRTRGGTPYTVTVDGVERRYVVHPPLAVAAGPRPLVVALHAFGQDPVKMEYTVGLDAAADQRNVFVVYPSGIGGAWNNKRPQSSRLSTGKDDVKYIQAVIADVEGRYAIDPDRIVVVGQGDGALMAAIAVARMPGRFSALVMVSGQLLTDPLVRRPGKPIATVLVHGTKDPIWPYPGVSDRTLGDLTSYQDTVSFFRNLNKQPKAAGTTQKLPDRDPKDGTTVSRTRWADTSQSGAALLESYVVTNGGHPWPGGAVQAGIETTRGLTSRDLDLSAVVTDLALAARRGGSGIAAPGDAPTATPTG